MKNVCCLPSPAIADCLSFQGVLPPLKSIGLPPLKRAVLPTVPNAEDVGHSAIEADAAVSSVASYAMSLLST